MLFWFGDKCEVSASSEAAVELDKGCFRELISVLNPESDGIFVVAGAGSSVQAILVLLLTALSCSCITRKHQKVIKRLPLKLKRIFGALLDMEDMEVGGLSLPVPESRWSCKGSRSTVRFTCRAEYLGERSRHSPQSPRRRLPAVFESTRHGDELKVFRYRNRTLLAVAYPQRPLALQSHGIEGKVNLECRGVVKRLRLSHNSQKCHPGTRNVPLLLEPAQQMCCRPGSPRSPVNPVSGKAPRLQLATPLLLPVSVALAPACYVALAGHSVHRPTQAPL